MKTAPAQKVSWMNSFKKHFFAGLVVLIPVGLTFYFLRLFFLLVSQTLFPVLTKQTFFTIHPVLIRPISFILTFILVWALGVVASNYIGRQLLAWVEKAIGQIPFFRGMYEAIQKMTEAIFGTNPAYQSVVMVEYPRKGMHTFGFVTSHNSGKSFGSTERHLCIFIPTVPNPTSGLLIYVPESEATVLDMSIEQAAKILVSHGFVQIESIIRK